MTEKEKSRSAGGTAEAGQRGAGHDRADRVPASEYNLFERERQLRIQNFLMHGRGNAIPGRKLMELIGAGDLRTVSKSIEAARRSGVPICATTSPGGPGYFIASSMEELNGYLRSLDHRLREVRVTRTHLEAALQSMVGQLVIGGFDDEE